jgi:hypothetical protein
MYVHHKGVAVAKSEHPGSGVDAGELLPKASAVLDQICALLPERSFEINYETLFVDPARSEEVACVTVLIAGVRITEGSTAMEFELDGDPHVFADALVRWRDRQLRDDEGTGS